MYIHKDHYFKKAKKEGYPARSVYKLQEINQCHRLIKPGCKVLELGCSPGSWLKYSAGIIGERGIIVGIDKQKMTQALPDNAHFIQADINQLSLDDLRGFCDCFDLLLSDMAPATTGIKWADEQASLELAEKTLYLAQNLLSKEGKLLLKVFEGGEIKNLVLNIKKQFKKVQLIRPAAVRKTSREIYVLALGKN